MGLESNRENQRWRLPASPTRRRLQWVALSGFLLQRPCRDLLVVKGAGSAGAQLIVQTPMPGKRPPLLTACGEAPSVGQTLGAREASPHSHGDRGGAGHSFPAEGRESEASLRPRGKSPFGAHHTYLWDTTLEVHHYGPNKMPSECLTYDRIRAALPSIFTVVEDAGDRINQLKSVKTSREIGKLKLAHQVVRAGAQAFYQLAEAGIREIDLATEVHCAVLRKAASLGIAYVFCEMPQITSGPDRTVIADTLSNHPTARKLQQGDPVLLELGAHAEGYWADITRAVVVGEPTPLLRRLHQAVLDAQAAAIASYVPGESTGEQLCQASWQAMREAGFEQGITHFLGHGLGFAYHEDRPTLGTGEHRPLLPGQVTSIEPGLYWREGSRPVGGIRVEENLVWGSRAGEAEILSDYYRGLDPAAGDF